MGTIKFRVLIISFICLAFSLNKTLAVEIIEARKVAEAELKKYRVKCGDSYYVNLSIASGVELKKEGSVILRQINLTESDKLNGFVFKGTLEFRYIGPARSYNHKENEWSEWVELRLSLDIDVFNKNGKWVTEKKAISLV